MLKHKGEWSKTPRATLTPTMIDIAWAAGVYEGEGSASPRPTGGFQLCVYQNDRWILDKLQALFGGTVSKPAATRRNHVWRIYGTRARGFLYTIFTHLSPRRRQQSLLCILYKQNP